MGKVSRRGLFGWLGAAAALSPFVALRAPVAKRTAAYRDAQRMYNYHRSKALEIMALQPKPPLIVRYSVTHRRSTRQPDGSILIVSDWVRNG